MNAPGRTAPRAELERAFLSSDPSFDGLFWTGVRTTGIFCRPSCRARKPKLENCEFFDSIGQALFAGYRPCLRCRPLEAPGAPPAWAAELIRDIDEDPAPRVSAADLRARGLDPARVRRAWKQRFGVTLAAYCRARRLGGALRRLRGGEALDDAIGESGYASHSGFREAFSRAVGSPPGKSRGLEIVMTRLIDSPVGPLVAGATEKGVALVEFSDRRALEAQLAALRRRLGAAIVPDRHQLLDQLARELEEYFAGSRREFDVPLVSPGTPFQEQVWAELRRIPYGSTISYEDLARRVGRPGACRAVGTANGMNRIGILIPCHRVVRKGGALGGYGGGLWRKEWLLAHETKHAAGR